MNVIVALFVLAAIGIVADTIVKVAKARSAGGAAKALRGELDEMGQQLADAQATILAQAESIQDLHERLDFTERVLTQAREKGQLRGGGEAGTKGS
jgi:hypothetical protein